MVHLIVIVFIRIFYFYFKLLQSARTRPGVGKEKEERKGSWEELTERGGKRDRERKDAEKNKKNNNTLAPTKYQHK